MKNWKNDPKFLILNGPKKGGAYKVIDLLAEIINSAMDGLKLTFPNSKWNKINLNLGLISNLEGYMQYGLFFLLHQFSDFICLTTFLICCIYCHAR
jgi:hypothetical protein